MTPSSQPWRPGSRIARLRANHTYGYVLGLIFVSFLFTSFAPEAAWSSAVLVLLQSATVVVALWTSGLGQNFRAGAIVAAISLAAAIGQLTADGTTLTGLVGILNVLLLVATAAVIGLGVIDQGEVNRQSITGAVCIYVLLGMAYTFAYSAAAKLGTGPFFAQGIDGTTSLQLYFSYVTLATLGYGDYTPAGNLGHTLAVTEALLGQLYLVTIVALLVGNLGRRRARPEPARAAEGDASS